MPQSHTPIGCVQGVLTAVAETFPYFDDINSLFPAIYRPRVWPVKTDPSRELCSQVLQYDERILTRLSDWCAPHIPCYTGTPIQSDPKTIVEQSLVRPQPVGPSLDGLAFCNHVSYQTPRLKSQAVNHSKSFRIPDEVCTLSAAASGDGGCKHAAHQVCALSPCLRCMWNAGRPIRLDVQMHQAMVTSFGRSALTA